MRKDKTIDQFNRQSLGKMPRFNIYFSLKNLDKTIETPNVHNPIEVDSWEGLMNALDFVHFAKMKKEHGIDLVGMRIEQEMD